VEFHAGSAVIDDNLCRWDETMPFMRSVADEYEANILESIFDSVVSLGMGKRMLGFSRPSPYSITVSPNPVYHGSTQFDFKHVYGAEVRCMLFDMSGRLLWESGQRHVRGGQTYSVPIHMEGYPSGTYYLIPVIDGMILPGTEIRSIK